MAEKTASLTVLGGPLAGKRCVLPESGTVTIGSATGSLMQLDLPTVSPFHARIQVEAGRVTVHDTGAERKVHVNDNPLEPGGTVLRNGDILWLGTPGEDDVVMLQCILPRRPAEAPSPAAEPVPPAPPVLATPTPEVETMALRAAGPEPSSPPATAEPVPEEPTGFEETLAIQPEGVVAGEAAAAPPGDEALVVAEPSLPGATEEEMVAAVEVAAESGDFIEETEAVVVEEGEVVAEPGPTAPTPAPDELAEPQPVAIDFGDTVAFAPEPVAPPAPPAEPELPPTVVSAPPPLPAAPASPPAAPAAPPIAAKPPAAAPLPPVARPVAPARPAPSRPAPRPGHPSASTPRPLRHPAPTPRPAAAPVEAEHGTVEAPPTPSAGKWRSPLLVLAGFAAVLVIAGLGWVAWRLLAARPSVPVSTPAPVAQASAPLATHPPAVPTPEATAFIPVAAPTPPVATPTPPVATPRPAPTPTPSPTPRATPTPARPTPPPAATGPSAEALRAQQVAAQAQALVAQAEAAISARQYDAAVSHLDGALGLEPGNARAASLRADAVRRRDLARRRFAPGRTVVQSPKAQKERAGDLAGFDTGDTDVRKAPDFLGRIDFEMSPASGVEPGDTWTLRVYVVNEGKKPIRVQGVTVATTVNGSAGGGPVPPRTREIVPQHRSLVAEATGAWREGTTSWTSEVTVDGGKGESLRNTLTWR
jgi:hypothetical protein